MNELINLLLFPFYIAALAIAVVAMLWYCSAVIHGLIIIYLYVRMMFGQDNKQAIRGCVDTILLRGDKSVRRIINKPPIK